MINTAILHTVQGEISI